MQGRIDVHTHLLPGVDDGCADVAESIACGRMLLAAGYSHAFCTPHIWPNLPHNNVEVIAQRTRELQQEFDRAGVTLKLLPGGELWCSDAIESPTRRSVEKVLLERRYFLLGTDTHRPDTLSLRLGGLSRAIELVGAEFVDQLTVINPR